MQEIQKHKNSRGHYAFVIKTDNGDFSISFENNFDLYWRYINKCSMLDAPESQEIIITKENYFLYELFYKLYESIKNNKVYYSFSENDFFEVDNNHLYKDNKIEWNSDDFYDEIASKLIIEKMEESFKVTFVKSKNWHDGIPVTYSVRFRNSGSKYDPFNISFMSMYKELKQYEPACHQIHVEEYLYKQKVLKR